MPLKLVLDLNVTINSNGPIAMDLDVTIKFYKNGVKCYY